jgi:hypothetical protein
VWGVLGLRSLSASAQCREVLVKLFAGRCFFLSASP